MKKIRQRGISGTPSTAVTDRELRGAAIARKAADESIVLLKNEDQILPVKTDTKIAVYGSGASRTIKGGTGSGDVNERDCISIYQGMKKAGYTICNEDWIRACDEAFDQARLDWRDEILEKANATLKEGESPDIHIFYVYSETPFVRPIGGPVEKTDAEVAFYILSRVAGEGADRYEKGGDYFLSEEEEKFLADLCGKYDKVVVALNTGGVVDLSFLDRYPQIKGLLAISQLGQEGGNAFADVVSGKVNPSGKLTDTWAYQYADYPGAANFSHNNGNVDEEVYEEGIYVGYRYFDSFRVPVRYGFGFGLSYTNFAWKVGNTEVYLDQDSILGIEIPVTVTNVGQRAGKEVIQIYASCPQKQSRQKANLEKERRRLAGFAKTVLLEAGESETLRIRIPLAALESYDEAEASWILEGGDYLLWIGNSLEAAVPKIVFTLARTVILEKVINICSPEREIKEITRSGELLDADCMDTAAACRLAEENPSEVQRISVDASQISSRIVTYRSNDELLTEDEKAFVNQLSEDQLASLVTGDPGKAQGLALGNAGNAVPGSAGETSLAAFDLGMPDIVLADGPAGLRLNREYAIRNGRPVGQSFKASIERGLLLREDEKDSQPGDIPYYQFCTAIPVGTALAQTWNVPLIEEVGAMVGGEMQEFGVTLWLAPGMNIHRNPLCGRNFEYYSEDPLVSGSMAAAMTRGVQAVKGCGTTIKHFACNNQEDNRMGVDSILSERALREIYLKGFEIAVKTADPWSMMTSYNKINGIHAANLADTCTDAARNEWGFDGLIMTDWTTTLNGPECTAAGCIRAGNDLVMPGAQSDQENLRSELADGSLSIEDLKACVARIYRITQRADRFCQ